MLPNQQDNSNMPINQQLGVEMENILHEQQKIHIQALNIVDPEWHDDYEHPLNIQDLVEYHIMFTAQNFTNIYDDYDLQDKVKLILYDNQDDKLGRIKDLYDAEIKTLAKFIATHHETNSFARRIYLETMANVI